MGLVFKDGEYRYQAVKDIIEDDFSNEKDLCEFIESNIEEFCVEVLDVEYLSHIREFQLVKTGRNRLKGNRRIDFFIRSKCGKTIGIECKHPTYISELSNCVGQCLSYIALFEAQGIILDRLVITSTRVDNILPLVIHKFRLPIEYVAMDKTKHLKFLRYGG